MQEQGHFENYSQYFKSDNFSTAGMDDVPIINRILVIGTCLTEAIKGVFTEPSDFILFWQGQMPSPPRQIADYDFQVVQIPLRLIIEDSDLMRLSYESIHDWEHALVTSKSRLDAYFKLYTKYLQENQKTTFVLNYISPCVNTIGRLHNPYDIRNIGHFIREINKYLQEKTSKENNAYIIDIDNLANMYGKRYFSEEFLGFYTHGGIGWPFPNEGLDGSRLEKTPHTVDHFEVLATQTLLKAIKNEIVAAWTTLKAHASVKLIVVDLDDTLWRGVVGELIKDDLPDSGGLMNAVWGDLAEGWPLGLVEALQICRMRGIILGILSKNSEDTIISVFPKVFGRKMSLDDFAIKRINWQDKVANMDEMLKIVNVLPENVLYIDDSPVERGLMLQKYPTMRVIGKYFQYSRHALISGPYAQSSNINVESLSRNKSIKLRESTIGRDSYNILNNHEFPSLVVNNYKISKNSSPLIINRLLELTQKTNQWKLNNDLIPDRENLYNFLDCGGSVDCFEVTLNDVNFGIVSVVFYQENEVKQFVMSCRVAGLNMERKFINRLGKDSNFMMFRMNYKDTSKNLPMREWLINNCQTVNGVFLIAIE